MINFNNQDVYVDVVSLRSQSKERTKSLLHHDIPTSDEITGIELRLSKVLVKNNGVERMWPFSGLSKLYLIVIVLSNIEKEPLTITVKGFPKVADNEELPIDRTLFFWKKKTDTKLYPEQIHTFISIVQSRDNVRDTGSIMAEVGEDGNYKNIVKSISSMNNSTPIGIISDMVTNVASIIGKHLGKINDKPLFTWIQSFTDIHGDMDKLGHNIYGRENQNVSVVFNLIIRDNKREQQ